MHQLIAYLKFLLNSTNQHGVHSPFIYNFVTKCLYDRTKYDAYALINKYRNTLKKSSTILKIKDLGEGSKVLDNYHRKVRNMVKTSSSSEKDTQLLFRIATYFQSKEILELGTSLGMGTYALALANSAPKVTTIDGCPNTSDFTKTKFEDLHITNSKFIKGDFTTIIPTLKVPKYNLIFFDGHHNKAATLQYFESLLSKVQNDTLFVFDDIYWSKGMTEAWEEIKVHPLVTVTVDCFHFGIVFFRREQVKEHFKIRV